MKLLLIAIILYFGSNVNSNACSVDSQCTAGQFCRAGICTAGKKCRSRDDCPRQGFCLGYSQQPNCLDAMQSSICNGCKITVTEGNLPGIVTFNGQQYDADCLQRTYLPTELVGMCKFDQITRALCFFGKFQARTMGFFAGVGFIISLGFMFLTNKTQDVLVKALTIFIAISFISGGAMITIIKVLTGKELAKCP